MYLQKKNIVQDAKAINSTSVGSEKKLFKDKQITETSGNKLQTELQENDPELLKIKQILHTNLLEDVPYIWNKFS